MLCIVSLCSMFQGCVLQFVFRWNSVSLAFLMFQSCVLYCGTVFHVSGMFLWLWCALCFRDVFHVSMMCSVLQQCVPCFRAALCDSGMCSVSWQYVSYFNCLRSCFLSQWQVMCCNKVFLFQWYILWVRDIFSGVENVSYLGNVFFVLEEEGRCVFHWCSPCFCDLPCFSDMISVAAVSHV